MWRGHVSRALPNQSVAKGVEYERVDKGEPITEAAQQWSGWGTALKPACELIVLARKPLSENTVAANVLKHGTGALNIDACRVETCAESFTDNRAEKTNDVYGKYGVSDYDGSKGRWPANVIHDGSEEVTALFPDSVTSRIEKSSDCLTDGVIEWDGMRGQRPARGYDGEGSAARFFYTAKADDHDRIGSKHPTVKPVDLIQYLVRLVCPKGGTILDPFAGTGTLGEAAWREGCKAMLIEREEEYQNDIRRRMKLALAGPDERKRESIKHRHKDKPQDAGPLFGGSMQAVGGGE